LTFSAIFDIYGDFLPILGDVCPFSAIFAFFGFFYQFSADKLAFLSKKLCYEQIFAKNSSNLSKKANFSPNF
jgi:hypothetical protein